MEDIFFAVNISSGVEDSVNEEQVTKNTIVQQRPFFFFYMEATTD